MAGPRFRILPPVAFGVPIVTGWGLGQWLGEPWPWPTWSVAAGAAALIVFALWSAWALVLMWGHRNAVFPGGDTRTLLSVGPYRVSRNPLYLGLVVFQVGLALLMRSGWILLLVPASIAAVTWGAILPEERYLRARFPAQYEDYARSVRRWI